jgi:hypothetical protein
VRAGRFNHISRRSRIDEGRGGVEAIAGDQGQRALHDRERLVVLIVDVEQ